ncbi:MAG TPA: VWA domain-containing protein [Verrucomicrobiae bacterium]|nr:VWA domain-containing protein [Verrucomicrobiae bacterium]
MRPIRIVTAFLLTAVLARPALTDTPPSPSPAQPAPGATKAPSGTPMPSPLVEQTRSELILIEVYARDYKGNVVRDLKPEDLVLKVDQNRAPKKIETLEFVDPESEGKAPEPAEGETAVEASPDQAPVLGAQQARRERPRRFLLFFDDDTSSPNNMTEARRSALRYLQGSGLATDQFGLAVYEQRRKLEILCPFTDDRGELTRALEASIADVGRFSDYALERVARREEIEKLQRVGGNGSVTGSATGNAAMIAGQDPVALMRQYANEDSLRMGRLVNNLKVLVESLAGWDGYKAIVFFSDGVPENPGLDYGLNDPRRALTDEFSTLAFSAGGSNVVLHTIQTTGVTAEGTREVGSSFRRSNALAALALDTGGIQRATNDLKGALNDIENSTHGYYLLSYMPEGPPDGAKHSINVKCKRTGVQLRYRQFFTRFTPEEARTRSVQAAYQVPEIHDALGAELSIIGGPLAGSQRVVDVVLYVPAGRLLYLPQPGGASASVEVGFVALDKDGRETLRESRRVQLGVDSWRALHGGAVSYDFYSRVKLPLGAQTLTAVISDLQSGDLGSARVSLDASGSPPPAVHGLSLYAVSEKSLWVQVEEGSARGAAPAATAKFTIGPTLRSRFFKGEKISCGFKSTDPASEKAGPKRLEVRRGEEVVTSIPVPDGGGSQASLGGGTHGLEVPTQGLENGEYVLSVEEDRESGPVELGRLPFRIATRR